MGNSHSQSSSRLHTNYPKEGRGKKFSVAKFASPENRVLPVVSNVPQRLRSTDNGSILHSGGTISGRKSNVVSAPNKEPEFVQLLQKKCHAVQTSAQNVSFQTLYGHRKSHSDPDIVRMMMRENENDNDSYDDEYDTDGRGDTENNSNLRSIIAMSPSKAKIKSRKKSRAPEPPQSNTLPRTLGKAPVYKNENHNMMNSQASVYDYNDAPRRPLPPIPPDEMPPPPPPPPPDYNQAVDSRGVSKTPNKNYEKNRRMVDKWKFSKPNQEYMTDNAPRQRSKSLDRTEEQRIKQREESKRSEISDRSVSLRNSYAADNITHPTGCNNQTAPNSVLKDAIADAAKRRAERLQRTRQYRNESFKSSMEKSSDMHEKHVENGGKVTVNSTQFAHKNPFLLKQTNSNKPGNSMYSKQESNAEIKNLESSNVNHCARKLTNHKKASDSRKDYVVDYPEKDEDKPSIQKQQKRTYRDPLEMPNSSERQAKWDSIIPESVPRFFPETTLQSSSTSEEEMEIDLQLRPTLPRRPVELPRFSPTDVWKSINLDFFKSHQQRSDVSSDDGEDIMEEKIHRINRPAAPRRLNHDRSGDSGISPDAGSPMLLNDNFDLMNNDTLCNTPDAQLPNEECRGTWIPQHDLVDDSDCGSDESPAETNKSPNSPTKVQAKFAMPNLMFPSRSLPRTEQKKDSDETVVSEKERTRSRGRRKKGGYKNAEGQHFNSLRNLKKALGLRTKCITDESKGLDSNWSLSRSLPNFINNLNIENAVKHDAEAPELYVLDHIRRSNSESKAVQQENAGSKPINAYSSRNPEWRKSFPCQSSEGHVMYLPEYSSSAIPVQHRSVADDIHVNTDSELILKKPSNRKKFTYQSTVRQEEKKKLEEKLAREVEARERKRQQEIEWMNKVEEEFRKQRDKEKINIRHQLRILNLQEKSTDNNAACRKDSTKRDIDYAPNIQPDTSKSLQTDHQDYVMCSVDTTHKSNQEIGDMEYNWKQPTGMKKWLKRQNRDYQCSARPEPEGGRSSSDDSKQKDQAKAKIAELPNRCSSYQTNKEFICVHGSEDPCGICNNFNSQTSNMVRSDNEKKSPFLSYKYPNNSVSPEKTADPLKSTRQQGNSKAGPDTRTTGNSVGATPNSNDHRFISESVEEYELHTRLCRTNSGRTFESHSYYALERRKEDPAEYDAIQKANCGTDTKTNFFSTLNFEKELKENVRKKTREFEKRTRLRDYDSDDSGSDGKEVRPQRPVLRNQKRKSSGEIREPSFSRNHPHRSGARVKSQVNGHMLNGRTTNYSKALNSRVMLPQQRVPTC